MLNPVGFSSMPLALPGCAQFIDVQGSWVLPLLQTMASDGCLLVDVGSASWTKSWGALRLRLLLHATTFFCRVRPHCQLVSCWCALIMGQDWADMAVVVVGYSYR
ncbi:hypothetical protein F5Y08DRAFT_169355 [Xylaria arbuscula]|nr:hypothetical protein F5Y08DRAFT_169355 [Xylaria arbuscula]